MRCSFSNDQANAFELENTSAFNILVAYEDSASGQRAQEFLERMATALPPEDPGCLRCAMWKFDGPMDPLRIKMAAEQAAGADAIFIVAHERKKMPHVLEKWIGLWLPQKTGDPCALVALLERHGEKEGGPRGIHSYLRKAAQGGNLAFFADGGSGKPGEALQINALFDDFFELDALPSKYPCQRLPGSRPEADLN